MTVSLTRYVWSRWLVLAILGWSGVGAAATATDWFSSVYTAEGVEVRGDERLFTLFALLNAMGYDQGPVVRKLPITKHEFSPVRLQVRHAVAGIDPKLRQEVDAFFDAHSLPLDRYVSYVAQLRPAPGFAADGVRGGKELAGFDKLLASFYADNHIHDLFSSLQPALRTDARAYLALLDDPMKKARALLRDPSSHLVVVVNDLDGQGQTQSVVLSDGPVVVVGSNAKADMSAVIRAYARAVLDPLLEKKTLSIKGSADQAAIVRGSGGPELDSGTAYSSELMARAIAIKLVSKDPGAEEDAALKQGFAGIKDAVKAVDDLGRGDKPLDAVVPEIFARIDLRKAR